MTMPIRSSRLPLMKFLTTSLTTSILLFLAPLILKSSASMLVEESIAKTISMPSLWILESASGDCGLARAKIINAAAIARK